jgi:hypothetical protein
MMVTKSVIYSLLTFSFFQATAQYGPPPEALARDSGNIHKACLLLKEKLTANPNDFDSNYNLACDYAVLSEIDSAFYFLQKSVSIDKDFGTLSDPDFLNLIGDKRWIDIEEAISAPYFKEHPGYDKGITLKLARMHLLDQAYYWHIRVYGSKDSSLVKHYWKVKDSLNLLNQKHLEELIESKGWPTISKTGKDGSGTAFLIIQHADLMKQKKYLAIITDLAIKNEASWKDVAYMTDRILIREGKRQLYGSQVNTILKAPYPIEDEGNLDKRRVEKGLGSMADYMMQGFGIKYKLPK